LARNRYDVDETLETPFSFKHLIRSFVYIKRHLGKISLSLVLSLIANACGLVVPLLMANAVDNAIPNKDVAGLVNIVLFMVGAMLVSVAFTTIKNVMMAKVGQDIVYDIREDLFEHLQKLPFSYYDSRPHGKILVRIVQYVNSVSDMMSNGLINIFLELFNLVIILVYMLIISPKLTLVVLAGMPVLIAVIIIIKPRQRRAWQGVSDKSSNLNAYIHESIDGMRVTQIFTREKTNEGIFYNLLESARKVWMKAIYVSNFVWYSVQNISQIVIAFVFVAGVFWMGGQVVAFGVILAMSSYAQRFWQPILNIANIYNTFINTIAYLERIFEAMDEPVAVDDLPGATELPQITGNVSYKDVLFEYDPGVQILKSVNFEVKAGESIALVGPTGAGKSTIVNVLSRFYNLSGGFITIDGHDISKATLSSLRSQMGIMLQDSFIFSGTIMDNIRYGRLSATDEMVVNAAKVVRADAFIAQMEHGYYTEVNERGSRLSQGQKQLIAFARTLLSDPRILILDEATSSIDTRTEMLLQEGLLQLLKGRTSFIIAHRLSTIRHCDRIMFIDSGEIAESGSHDELMAAKGSYYRLYMSQLQE
jgi:ABC-type multidrug transport system, ATPase and permease components